MPHFTYEQFLLRHIPEHVHLAHEQREDGAKDEGGEEEQAPVIGEESVVSPKDVLLLRLGDRTGMARREGGSGGGREHCCGRRRGCCCCCCTRRGVSPA